MYLGYKIVFRKAAAREGGCFFEKYSLINFAILKNNIIFAVEKFSIMLEIIFFSFIAAAIVVYVIPRGGCSMGQKKCLVPKENEKISTLNALVANQISYFGGMAFLDYTKDRRRDPEMEKAELKEKVKANIQEYAMKECHMDEEELDDYLDKQIRRNTNK